MDISFECDINDSIIENNQSHLNDSFSIEDEIFDEQYKIINNISVQINKDNNKNVSINKEISNPFLNYHKKVNDFINDDQQNSDQLYFISFSNNNTPISNINKETNSTDLNADKPKVKQIFEIKKETLPKFFTENSINNIIRQYDIGKELKLKLLLDINSTNKDIEQIKRVLESDTKKRRKTCKNNLYRTDHILIKLINIINLSLSNFINNLIAALYSKETIFHILNGLITPNKIRDHDLKKVIKMNAYITRSKLETREEKLNFLNLSLRKYFSDKISTKYKKLKESSNYNELIIEKLLSDVYNNDIFDFVLNDLLIKDWLEILLYKKNFKDFEKYNLFDKIKKNKIKDNLERIDKYIDKIYKSDKIYKNNKVYFHCFVLIAYNLNRFLMSKETRNKTKINEKQEKKGAQV